MIMVSNLLIKNSLDKETHMTQTNRITELLYTMFMASDQGDNGAAEEAHSLLRVEMNKIYPEIKVEPEMVE